MGVAATARSCRTTNTPAHTRTAPGRDTILIGVPRISPRSLHARSIVNKVSDSGLGRWEPLSVTDTVDHFRDAPFRWWVSGGRALELYLGRSWRRHDDTDVGITRGDAPALPPVLAGWDIQVAAGDRLYPWDGGELSGRLNQNNLGVGKSRPVPGAST